MSTDHYSYCWAMIKRFKLNRKVFCSFKSVKDFIYLFLVFGTSRLCVEVNKFLSTTS